MPLNRVALVDLQQVSIDDLEDVDTTTVAPSQGQALTWDGTAWVPGAGGGGGAGPERLRRQSWQPPYSYIGTAADGTAEGDSGWVLTRVQVLINGAVEERFALGSWTGRAAASYGVEPLYQGGQGEPLRRHDFSGGYSYLGVASYGTTEASPTWQLTRVAIAANGVATTLTAVDSWNNRAAATYS